MVAVGVARATGQCDKVTPGLEKYAVWIKATTCYYPTADAYVREDEAVGASRTEAGAASSVGRIPVLVLSQDSSKPIPPFLKGRITDADWKASSEAHDEDQKAFLTLSPRSRRVIATGSGHYIQYDQPGVVVAETVKLIDEIRSSKASPGGL